MTLRDDVSERAAARVGQTLKSKWRLDSVLGIGGMATVYAATHRNRSRAAIKMLHSEVAISQDVTGRFLREGYVGNAVAHPGTVKVLDDDITEDGAPFLVMELLEGESLGARLDREGAFSPQAVAQIACQLLDVLSAAHAAHIVHRDLKPDNVFLTVEGQVKVLDFGIARLRESAQENSASTQAGSLLGTPAFMAPEQALGRWKEVDERTDIWAVGATLFTLLTGRYVHEAEALQEQLVLAATSRAPAVQSLAPHTPPWLCQIVDRSLSFAREARFADARSMQAALRESAAGFELVGYARPAGAAAGSYSSGSDAAQGVLSPPQQGSPVSFGEEATLAASERAAAAASSTGSLASVQAVSRSARGPSGSRPARAWPMIGTLGLAAAAAGATVWWASGIRPSQQPAVLPTQAAGARLAPSALSTLARSPGLPAIVSVAPPSSAEPPPAARVLNGRVPGHAKKPPVPSAPASASRRPPEPRENLFDNRH